MTTRSKKGIFLWRKRVYLFGTLSPIGKAKPPASTRSSFHSDEKPFACHNTLIRPWRIEREGHFPLQIGNRKETGLHRSIPKKRNREPKRSSPLFFHLKQKRSNPHSKRGIKTEARSKSQHPKHPSRSTELVLDKSERCSSDSFCHPKRAFAVMEKT